MRYDFDVPVDRRGTDSLKWNIGEGELPMWVADMDFPAAKEIKEAIIKRAEHGVYGYTEVPKLWYDAYTGWWEKRHGFKMDASRLIFCTGVIPAISSIVRKFTCPNEKVIIQTPVYNIFFNSVLNNGCRVSENPLIYKDGSFYMDFDDLEKKMADPMATLFILCNPQNPSGNIWSREELKKIGELALKYHVTVVSDEIHCDITDPGYEYVPFASVSDECRQVGIVCIAPTKTFNIAGIQTAAVYVPDEYLRFKVWRALNTDEVAEPNVFACEAAAAAYLKGGEWLDDLKQYLFENKRTAYDYIEKEIPELKPIKSHATYLMWIDISAWKKDSREAANIIRKKTGLVLSEGHIYGGLGNKFLRMNLACPRAMLLDGLNRLNKSVRGIENED